MNTIPSHQVLVVGGGPAGLRAAIEANKTCDAALMSRMHPLRCVSLTTQEGIHTAIRDYSGSGDTDWAQRALDTIEGGDYLADQDAVEVMCREVIERIIEMESWGADFSRSGSGPHLLHILYEQVGKRDPEVYEGWLPVSLTTRGSVSWSAMPLQTWNWPRVIS